MSQAPGTGNSLLINSEFLNKQKTRGRFYIIHRKSSDIVVCGSLCFSHSYSPRTPVLRPPSRTSVLFFVRVSTSSEWVPERFPTVPYLWTLPRPLV